MTVPVRTPPAPSEVLSRPLPPRRPEIQTPRTATGRTYSAARHLRAALVLLAISVLLLGVAYPLAIVGFGQLVNPHGANGSLVYNANGTVNHSQIVPPGVNSTLGGWTPLPTHPASGRAPAPPPPGETISYRLLAIGLGDRSGGRTGSVPDPSARLPGPNDRGVEGA